MTVKKPLPLIKEPIDWVRIIQAVATAIVLVMTSWVTLNMNKVASGIERTEKTVEQVKKQTDGSVTASLKALAISAENLAAVTKTPEKIKAAADAWEAYEARVRVQEKAEQPTEP